MVIQFFVNDPASFFHGKDLDGGLFHNFVDRCTFNIHGGFPTFFWKIMDDLFISFILELFRLSVLLCFTNGEKHEAYFFASQSILSGLTGLFIIWYQYFIINILFGGLALYIIYRANLAQFIRTISSSIFDANISQLSENVGLSYGRAVHSSCSQSLTSSFGVTHHKAVIFTADVSSYVPYRVVEDMRCVDHQFI